jgi:hypothetical protein
VSYPGPGLKAATTSKSIFQAMKITVNAGIGHSKGFERTDHDHMA